jgi:replication factor C small subunit
MTLQEGTIVENGKKIFKVQEVSIDSNKMYTSLVTFIKDKNTTKFQSAVKDIKNYEGFFKYLYKNIENIFTEKSIGPVIIMIHAFMNSNVLPRDGEITLLAFCFQLVRNNDIQFKE